MKRLLALLTILLMIFSVSSALAWEVSPEMEALAAERFPGYAVLDGLAGGDHVALLLTSPEGETRLGFCDAASAGLTQPLPEELFRIADAHLFANAAVLLAEDYEGTVYLVCCDRVGSGWAATISTPLPEGTTLLSIHVEEGCSQLSLPLRAGDPLTAEVRLTDGAWQLTGLMCPTLWLDFRANGILGPECAWYGDVAFDGDITRLDWTALPTDEAAVLALPDTTRWRFLAGDTPALREGTQAMDFYRMGTPVRLLEEPAGETVLVAVFGGEVRIRVPVAALTDAADQFAVDEFGIHYNPTRRGFPSIEITPEAAIPLYDAPDGEPIHTLAAGELHEIGFHADCAGEGWFHVEALWSDVDGYLRAADLPADEPIVQAGLLLPDYAFHAGDSYDGYCSFLMTNPAGERVFVGGVYMDGGWVFTESTPLPEGSVMDSYHSGSGSFILEFPHPEGEMSRWFEGEPVWITVVAYPQEDGRWMVETIHNENEEAFHFERIEAPGIHITLTGMLWGTVTLERDMRHIDWSTLPLCLEEALPYLAEDMGVIGVDRLPLYSDASASRILISYRYATPVTVLAREGSMAQVRIADSDVTGWVDVNALLLGAAQLIPDREDPDWLATPAYYADTILVPAGTAYYDAPEGNILGTTRHRTNFTIIAQYGSWYHVCWPESQESCYVRVTDGTLND